LRPEMLNSLTLARRATCSCTTLRNIPCRAVYARPASTAANQNLASEKDETNVCFTIGFFFQQLNAMIEVTVNSKRADPTGKEKENASGARQRARTEDARTCR